MGSALEETCLSVLIQGVYLYNKGGNILQGPKNACDVRFRVRTLEKDQLIDEATPKFTSI